jgi:hypothetical protein
MLFPNPESGFLWPREKSLLVQHKYTIFFTSKICRIVHLIPSRNTEFSKEADDQSKIK